MFGDSFFKKVEKKTNVSKDTILSLANKLQDGNMKDEKTLSEVVDEIATMTGKNISKEKKEKILPLWSWFFAFQRNGSFWKKAGSVQGSGRFP